MTKHDDFATITTEQLDTVTGAAGGGFLSNAWNWASKNLGGLLGGGGINANAQIGNNQRSAQGNQGPVSLGDNSPITIGQPPAQQ